MPIWHAYHCGSAFSISRTRLSRSLEWLVVTLTICCRVHIFDTFSCGNKAVLILPRGQDRPVLPERVANRIRSNFLPRGASLTIYYNYRIIKEACVQTPTPFSVMRGKPKKKSKTSTKCRSRKHKNNVQNSPANTKESTKDDSCVGDIWFRH